MVNTPSMQQLLEAGVHFGHQVRRGNPRMGEYIFGVREGVHIINLEFSEKLLKEAAEYAYSLGKEGKVLLFVGTKKQAQAIIAEAAQKAGAPYIDYRWVPGLLTNFDEVRKNINKLMDLKVKQEKGELSHYTKREQLLISRKVEQFEKAYGGIAKMDKLPDVVFLADCVGEKIALNEAIRVGISSIGIADTNCNPALLDYPIPGNDDATKSIRIMVDAIAEAYGAGIKAAGGPKEEKPTKVEEKKEAEPSEDSLVSEEVAAAEEKVEKEELEKAERVIS